LIFVLAADLLQSAINKAFREGLLRAPFPPDFGMDFPVVQYADGTLVIFPADIEQVLVMKNILEKYATFFAKKKRNMLLQQASRLIFINLQ
jgi:hypothetical protein